MTVHPDRFEITFGIRNSYPMSLRFMQGDKWNNRRLETTQDAGAAGCRTVKFYKMKSQTHFVYR